MSEAQEGTLFKAEYERELEAWLRRRYGRLLGVAIGWYVLMLLISVAGILLLRALPTDTVDSKLTPEQAAQIAETRPVLAISILTTILILAVTARAFLVVRGRLETREQMLRAASWYIVQVGLLAFVSEFALGYMRQEWSGSGLSQLFFLHFAACLFLPWTPRESLRPMYPLISMFVLLLLVFLLANRIGVGELVAYLAAVPFVLVPGLLISWWRLSRRRRAFDREMVAKGFFSMRRELSQARAVQLALFPRPIRSPNLEFDFSYIPANEVGGDFIHASVDAKGRLDVVLLDVTGHGLASALTVSRLSGEIERLLAEDPDIEPGHVLRMLNRYVNLTLSRHGVYATALCIQVDPATGGVVYANAGHPPAFVRRASGAVERMDSTTWLLGAAPDSMFESEQVEFALGPRDTLVLVTDGAHEAHDRKGQQFGLERLTEALARTPEPDRWCQHVTSMVEQWRRGVGDDDLLVASIRTPLAAPAPPKVRPRGVDIDLDTSMGMGMSPYPTTAMGTMNGAASAASSAPAAPPAGAPAASAPGAAPESALAPTANPARAPSEAPSVGQATRAPASGADA
jgi:hypothetical protein